MQWVGWIFDTRRQRWCRVCAVEGLGPCSKRLGQIARLCGVPDRYAAMTTGGAPTFQPAARSHQIAQDELETEAADPSPREGENERRAP